MFTEHGSEDMETLPNGLTFITSVCIPINIRANHNVVNKLLEVHMINALKI